MNPYFGFFFATTTLIIAVPTAIKVYNWVLTLWRGDIQLNMPNLFAIGFIFTFVHGGLTGLFLGNVTVDLPLSDTYFVIAHFHMVMGVSPVMVLFGAIYHWFPKITGKMPNEMLGQHPLLDDVPRHVRDLPADALPRHPRHAAPLLRVRQHGLHPGSAHAVNEAITIAAIVVGDGAGDLPDQRVLQPAQGQAGGRQSVARDDARVADAADAARAWQLGTEAAGRLSLGVRLQRAGRSEGLRPAERAAERPQRRSVAKPTSDALMLTAMVIAMLTAITAWWLLVQRLKEKPWTKQGVVPTSQETVSSSAPKIGLWVFLAVVSSLFGLFASAYVMRMRDATAGSTTGRRSSSRACCGSTRWCSCSRAARCRSHATASTRRLRAACAPTSPRRVLDRAVPRRPSARVAAGRAAGNYGPGNPGL